MSIFKRVVWTEGMFLQPQHYQQQDRHIEQWVETRTSPLVSSPWGLMEVEFDEPSLQLGRISLTRVRGVFPDGTPIDAPAVDALPPAFEFPADAKDVLVMIALPVRRANTQESSLGGEQEEALMRYVAKDLELRDTNSSLERNAHIQVGQLNIRMMLKRDATQAYTAIGLLKVLERKADGALIVDKAYIPPALDIKANQRLIGFATEIQAMLHQRGEALAAHMGKPGAGGISEIADFLMLQSVNRYEPLFAHYARLSIVHPERLYSLCLETAGDLAAFASQTRRPKPMLEYLHEDLERCYGLVMAELRALLSMVMEQRAIAIELIDRKYGVRTATVADLGLLSSANFILAINAQMPGEQLRARFPHQVKIGPVERIRDLVNLALPGVTLRGMAVAPREIPYHAGFHYFELERQGDLWDQLKKTGHMAMHIAGDFPGLELELWAIRQG
ncbi:MAG: type VI secretion system baseplate subunit TssK [Burkholderiaceae bacterium]|nr:type VI secretion system baseplate subunit TssK [Burkholderiaceae bacterium]